MPDVLKSVYYFFAALVLSLRTGKKHTVRKTVTHGAIINGVFRTDIRTSAQLTAEVYKTGKPMVASDYEAKHTTWEIV